MTLDELKRERHHLAAKVSSLKKKGKDFTEIRNQELALVAQIKAMQSKESKPAKKSKPAKAPIPAVVAAPKPIKKTPAPAIQYKSWTKPELKKCAQEMARILDENDWTKGYQFRSSECMYIKDINTNIGDNCVELTYILQYKTKVRRVENTVTKQFTPDTLNSLQKYIDDMELWVMKNSGDMDDKQIVFGTRFNKVQFEKQKMEKLGWKIYK